MSSKYQAHQTAHTLYFDGKYSEEQVAEKAGISGRTLANWIKEGSWQRLRNLALIAPMHILSNFINQLAELQKDISTHDEGSRYSNAYDIERQRKLLRCIIDMQKFPTGLIISYAANIAPVSDIVEEDEPEKEPAASPLDEFKPYTCEKHEPIVWQHYKEPIGNEPEETGTLNTDSLRDNHVASGTYVPLTEEIKRQTAAEYHRMRNETR
jgi:hypothetical protein